MVDYERRHHGPKGGRKRRYRGQCELFPFLEKGKAMASTALPFLLAPRIVVFWLLFLLTSTARIQKTMTMIDARDANTKNLWWRRSEDSY